MSLRYMQMGFILFVVISVSLLSSGCDRGPFEEAGEDIDEGIEDVGEGVEDMGTGSRTRQERLSSR